MEIKTVGVVIISKDKVLLVRHLEGGKHINDTYGLPAGRVEMGEENIDAAIRELREETGLIANTADLVALPLQYRATIKRKDGEKAMVMEVFLCLKYSGELVDSSETSPEWVEINKLGILNLIPNVNNAIQQALDYILKKIVI